MVKEAGKAAEFLFQATASKANGFAGELARLRDNSCLPSFPSFRSLHFIRSSRLPWRAVPPPERCHA
jgi:hypothetical protein